MYIYQSDDKLNFTFKKEATPLAKGEKAGIELSKEGISELLKGRKQEVQQTIKEEVKSTVEPNSTVVNEDTTTEVITNLLTDVSSITVTAGSEVDVEFSNITGTLNANRTKGAVGVSRVINDNVVTFKTKENTKPGIRVFTVSDDTQSVDIAVIVE